MALRRTIVALGGLFVLGLGTELASSAQVTPDGVSVQSDVEYGSAEGQVLQMDVFNPAGDAPRPAVLMFHPGGFVGGDKIRMTVIGEFLAANEYVAFSIGYRLARDFPYPAAVQDAKTAVQFIRDHADRFNVDPLRIGALGASAGATIAASLGLEGDGPLHEGSRVAAVVSWSGLMDLTFTHAPNERSKSVGPVRTYVGIQRDREVVVEGEEALTLLRRASPVTYLDASDPPMFLANGRMELIPFSQLEDMRARLVALGIRSEIFAPDHGHAMAYAADAIDPSLQFLDRYLRDYEPVNAPSARPVGDGGPPVMLLVIAGALIVVLVLLRLRSRQTAAHYR